MDFGERFIAAAVAAVAEYKRETMEQQRVENGSETDSRNHLNTVAVV